MLYKVCKVFFVRPAYACLHIHAVLVIPLNYRTKIATLMAPTKRSVGTYTHIR